ncbi:MAG: CoF synthetase, partial [Acidobacteria bacterium]|nr:CoF synthetase [Acidobacteriota bacterium]
MLMYLFGELKTFPGGLTGDDISGILSRAHQLKKEVESLPMEDILSVFDKLASLWIDREYPYTKEAMEKLPGLIHFDSNMVYEGIKTMCSLLARRSMEIRVGCDIGGTEFLDQWTYHKDFKGYMMARPKGVVAHVSAGNVFVGGVDSLIQGLATKNVNIMKMSTVDPLFPILFAKSLKENDHTGILHRAMALLHWKGGTSAIEGPIKTDCNAVVVYGGADTIRSYRKGLGLHTELVEYGPKYSFVIVQETALREKGIAAAAKLIARDGLMWEQSACSSPHVVYVEGKDNALALAKAISDAYDDWYKVFPQGELYDDEKVEITKVRELAKVEKALGKGDLFIGKRGFSTVVYQEKKEFQVSCLNRTLFVKALDRVEDVFEIIKPMGKYIQTVAILADDEKAKEIAAGLSLIGADRMVEPGKMAVRKHGTPHDGTKGLGELIQWVSLSRDSVRADWELDTLWEKYHPEKDGFDFLDDESRDALTLERIRRLVKYVKEHSPLLSKRYGDREIKSLEDFRKLPLLTGEDYKTYLPPMGTGLLTSEINSGYVFSSGGTTGAPKVVYRTLEEQHFNAVRLGKGLLLSV